MKGKKTTTSITRAPRFYSEGPPLDVEGNKSLTTASPRDVERFVMELESPETVLNLGLESPLFFDVLRVGAALYYWFSPLEPRVQRLRQKYAGTPMFQEKIIQLAEREKQKLLNDPRERESFRSAGVEFQRGMEGFARAVPQLSDQTGRPHWSFSNLPLRKQEAIRVLLSLVIPAMKGLPVLPTEPKKILAAAKTLAAKTPGPKQLLVRRDAYDLSKQGYLPAEICRKLLPGYADFDPDKKDKERNSMRARIKREVKIRKKMGLEN